MNRSVTAAALVHAAALFQGLTLVSFPVAFVSSMLTAALMFRSGTASFIVGGLRASLPLEELYRVSAIYPAIVLGLIAVTVRLIHSKQWAPA